MSPHTNDSVSFSEVTGESHQSEAGNRPESGRLLSVLRRLLTGGGRKQKQLEQRRKQRRQRKQQECRGFGTTNQCNGGPDSGGSNWGVGRTDSIEAAHHAVPIRSPISTCNSNWQSDKNVNASDDKKQKRQQQTDGAEGESNNRLAEMTLHEKREREIFKECRFIPINTAYKKVAIQPMHYRSYFSAPDNVRPRGSRMLYDIDLENCRHHVDCSRDHSRSALSRVCPRYCKPSQFRYVY